ncbi:MAG: 3'-5' exonuclease [Gammaproteobacteria bacterium]|nr:3'-5' exonuclease [Gammaproteobacteria bacterium]MBU0771758.1 3'-5' exonuclease [Gammaproteobacteria bacterium]MBU0855514.1 3'-5' exonuclease [Gammaproteobacteria bacterium]MBU1846076.1 3'-5' exonuclease [Gammaproteobacteria bacterium]
MKTALFYDTETTGLPDFKAPSEAEHQPHIVQLAALLVDLDTRETLRTIDVIICPDGWFIPDESSAVHGITQEHALEVGISEASAIKEFMDLWAGRLRIAHNEQFDARILRIALMRFLGDVSHSPPGLSIADEWKQSRAECTARMATPVCAIPPTERMKAAGRFHHKTPNLGEAYRHLFGRDFEGAHNALADVSACRDIYFAMLDMKEAA